LQRLMWRDAVSKGPRYLPTACDHRRCLNNDFIAESLESQASE
jgi:hypothetical protein